MRKFDGKICPQCRIVYFALRALNEYVCCVSQIPLRGSSYNYEFKNRYYKNDISRVYNVIRHAISLNVNYSLSQRKTHVISIISPSALLVLYQKYGLSDKPHQSMKTKTAFRYSFEENFVSLVKSKLELSEEASVQQIVLAF